MTKKELMRFLGLVGFYKRGCNRRVCKHEHITVHCKVLILSMCVSNSKKVSSHQL